MTTVLLWDIDGTLLTTGRAGIFALEDAASEVVGKRVELADLKTAGLTDRQIAANILQLYGISPDLAKIEQLLQLYGEYLPASLPRRQGGVLQGVREILDQLHLRTDAISFLLTGNIAAGARAKLAYYGLDSYFIGGAFSDETGDRSQIARNAKAMAEKQVGTIPPEKLYVIGDTPHDIHCGQAIAARVVAVASGSYSVEALEKHQPWWTISCLPEPSIFLEKLGLT